MKMLVYTWYCDVIWNQITTDEDILADWLDVPSSEIDCMLSDIASMRLTGAIESELV